MTEAEASAWLTAIEERIDDLAEAMARSQRISQISKIVIVGGLMWILATIAGVIAFVPSAVITAVAAMIGGVVLFGSTTTTAKETSAAMQATEAQRAELIGRMQLRVVGEDKEG
jgi:ATP/ADP translocase